jgi:hypothetical protein
MKVINVSTPTQTLNALLKQARRENIILRTPDGVEFILAEIDDFDREIALTRQNEELMLLLDYRARQGQAIGVAEVREQLDLR